MPQTFDPATLKTWDQTREIDIETSRGDGAPVHRTTIWIVVDSDIPYVRSVRGQAGRWYRELVANPRGAVHAAQDSVAVTASPAADSDSVARVSAAFERKYRAGSSSSTDAMLRDATLPTTLRLDPA
jgi:hypothetical protein